MKVALSFFGLTRSLRYTIESIENNILKELNKNNIEYDIFLHTFFLETYTNTRVKQINRFTESIEDMDQNEYKLLKPKYLQIDKQDEIKKEINMEQYRTHKDPWNSKYNSVDNFILGQYSKLQIVKMIEKSDNSYDYIIYLRPDVLYLNKFDIKYLKKIKDDCICIPEHNRYGKYLFNDRFAITNQNTYKIYGNGFNDLLDISKIQPLHSETVLGERLCNNNIKFAKIPIKFQRIRANGEIDKLDLGKYYNTDN